MPAQRPVAHLRPIIRARPDAFSLPVLLIYSILNGMSVRRLGDDIDDFCVKCKRVSNHAVVSLVEDNAAKVRCQACYSEHDYRREIAPPTKRELKKIADAAKAAELAATGSDEASS